MAARLDVKNILSIFNESRLQADQDVQKQKLAEMNRLLEERKMEEEADYHNKSISVQRAEQEANARFREGSLAEQARQNDLTAERYKAETAQQAVRDAALAQYYKDQIKLGYAQLNKEKATATNVKLEELRDEQGQRALQSGFVKDLSTAMQGLDLNADWSKDGTLASDPTTLMNRVKFAVDKLKAGYGVFKKYQENNYDASTMHSGLLKQMGSFMDMMSATKEGVPSAYGWEARTLDKTAGEYAPQSEDVSKYYDDGAGMFTYRAKQIVPDSLRHEAWNAIQELKAMHSQFPAVQAKAAGLVYDPKYRVYVQPK